MTPIAKIKNKTLLRETIARLMWKSTTGEWIAEADLGAGSMDDLNFYELVESAGRWTTGSMRWRLTDKGVAFMHPKSAAAKAYNTRQERAAKYQAIAARLYREFTYQVSMGTSAADRERLANKYNIAQWQASRVSVAGWYTYGWDERRSGKEGGYYERA